MNKSLVILLATLSFHAIAYEKTLEYECRGVSAVGFIFKPSVGWITSTFPTNTHKIFAVANRSKSLKYKVQLSDKEDFTDIACEDFTSGGVLICNTGIVSHFKFNKNNMRFIYSYDFGYFNVGLETQSIISMPSTDEKSNTPLLEIGTCYKVGK